MVTWRASLKSKCISTWDTKPYSFSPLALFVTGDSVTSNLLLHTFSWYEYFFTVRVSITMSARAILGCTSCQWEAISDGRIPRGLNGQVYVVCIYAHMYVYTVSNASIYILGFLHRDSNGEIFLNPCATLLDALHWLHMLDTIHRMLWLGGG